MSKALDDQGRGITPYQLFMLALCVWAILSLSAGVVFSLEDGTQTILDYADNAVCALFFLDFLSSLYHAPRRWIYLASWGWIDLLSSIPTVDALRWGRTARLVRILRVLRGVKSARALAHFVVARRAQSAFLAAMLLTLLLIVFASVAMLQFETSPDANIRTAEDALWWSVSTMTTVGYGDTYPRSPEGRMVAVFLMAAGVGVFGTFSGLIAAWFLSPQADNTESDVEQLKAVPSEVSKGTTQLS